MQPVDSVFLFLYPPADLNVIMQPPLMRAHAPKLARLHAPLAARYAVHLVRVEVVSAAPWLYAFFDAGALGEAA